MSDARAEYEAAVDNATAECDLECTRAYQKMRAACDLAWYTYCVRSGMVSAPTTEGYDNGRSGGSEGTEVGEGRSGGSDSESAARADDSESPGEGAESVQEPGAADAVSAPDPG